MCYRGYFLTSKTMCQSDCSSVVLDGRTMTCDSSVMNLFVPTVKVAWDTSDDIRWKMIPATSSPTAVLSAPTSIASGDLMPNGLSRDARVGIAVGVPALITAVIVAAVLFWRRRAKRHKTSKRSEEDDIVLHKAELPGEGKRHAELADETQLHETEANDVPKEVAKQRAPAELDSNWAGWEAPALVESPMNEPEKEQIDNTLSDPK